MKNQKQPSQQPESFLIFFSLILLVIMRIVTIIKYHSWFAPEDTMMYWYTELVRTVFIIGLFIHWLSFKGILRGYRKTSKSIAAYSEVLVEDFREKKADYIHAIESLKADLLFSITDGNEKIEELKTSFDLLAKEHTELKIVSSKLSEENDALARRAFEQRKMSASRPFSGNDGARSMERINIDLIEQQNGLNKSIQQLIKLQSDTVKALTYIAPDVTSIDPKITIHPDKIVTRKSDGIDHGFLVDHHIRKPE